MIGRRERNARVIAVTSGKGGVGKTNLSVNLSVALARLGKQAMLIDGDMGLANANILLGLNATATIADVLARDCALDDVVQQGPSGLRIVPGHSGSGILPGLDKSDRRRLDHVRESVFRKRCCLEAVPESRASAAFTRIARALSDKPMPPTAGGHRFFGMEAMHGAH